LETLIIACNTIRNELEKVAEETKCPYDFVWIESGLHQAPDSLRKRLQEELDRTGGANTVLLAFGCCNNAVVGLKTGDYQLIIPRVDDCITLLLGSIEDRERCCRQGGVHFLTKGWLEDESNVWTQYQSVLANYGKRRTDLVFRNKLAGYKSLGIIDTGAYDLQGIMPDVTEIAGVLNLELLVVKGTDDYLRRLLSGPRDDVNFATIPPGATIELEHLGLSAKMKGCTAKPGCNSI
jgi:hypothetical protein